MKYVKYIALVLALLVPSGVFAQTATTSAAGSPGQRLYQYIFSATGTFTVPTGVTTLFATGCAAGGGGAGGHTADPGGGGGGGAGGPCVVRMPIRVTQGSTITVTLGTAGVGAAAGSSGGVVNVNTTIAGGTVGTYTVGGNWLAPGTGTVTNGGRGGQDDVSGGGGATGTGAGAASALIQPRSWGGDYVWWTGGGAGGGATGPGAGGNSLPVGGLGVTKVSGGAANGTKGGGGAGGNSIFGMGGVGGSNAAGTNATAGGCGGGGGGGAPTFAGGNGTGGCMYFEWFN